MRVLKTHKPDLHILQANPRGFCAGVVRAINIVEQALHKYGTPIYVRHEIVHNKFVVENLQQKGVIFVESLNDIPDKAHVIFSAHGVPKSIEEEAQKRNLIWIDATCPLVSKVHIEAQQHYQADRNILMIGHKGHPEVTGTMGQLSKGYIMLIETPKDAETIQINPEKECTYITQTTLSLDDTSEIINILKRRFPNIIAPHKEDICYATTNRQNAVKKIAPQSDILYVIGSYNSSNSIRLVETAQQYGSPQSKLIVNADDIDIKALYHINTLGLTASASAPEELMQSILDKLSHHFTITVEELTHIMEDVEFKIPAVLRQ